MTIDELIARLNDFRDELGGDAQVRLMTQAHWPLEYTILGLASHSEIDDYDDPLRGDEDDDDEAADDSRSIYIVEGQQLGYGSTSAWHVAR
jgi:hypothetical protein